MQQKKHATEIETVYVSLTLSLICTNKNPNFPKGSLMQTKDLTTLAIKIKSKLDINHWHQNLSVPMPQDVEMSGRDYQVIRQDMNVEKYE